ncbi:MAG: DUF362 domain-containing protein [Lachnospiraceae bacterium]|nr:DUF362 domain-containing protein [Lachnospiraceae bacterium]
MKKSTVIIIPQKEYNENIIYKKLSAAIDSLGGLGNFVKKEDNILVKPNFLSPSEADSSTVTHPEVIRAVVHLLSDFGCNNVKYGDSPGHGTCKAAADKLGLTPENTFGAKLTPMNEEHYTEFADGMTAKEFHFTKEVVEADAIINVCKMKTHALETITGAVKNVYGYICGLKKAAGHVKYPNASVFARMLADIHRCTNTSLHIMDGIVAMEGNGPGSGTPTPMNVILVSSDPVAVDTVFCHLVDVNPELIPTNAQGAAMGIGTMNADEIELRIIEEAESGSYRAAPAELSAIVSEFGNPEYDVDRVKKKKTFLSRFSSFMTGFQRKPYIDGKECIKCGICVNHCPVPGKAVDFTNGKDKPPVYDYNKCIRCYCCQEMCPKSAIKVKGSKRRKS